MFSLPHYESIEERETLCFGDLWYLNQEERDHVFNRFFASLEEDDLRFGELRFFHGNLSGSHPVIIARFSLFYFGRVLREEVTFSPTLQPYGREKRRGAFVKYAAGKPSNTSSALNLTIPVTLLARSEPASANRLVDLFVSYRKIMNGEAFETRLCSMMQREGFTTRHLIDRGGAN